MGDTAECCCELERHTLGDLRQWESSSQILTLRCCSDRVVDIDVKIDSIS